MGAIVKVDKRHYRKIAQENWGLTDEQMKGTHVHHRTPRSQGGSNDATNLYVCSPWFHAYIWHGEDYFTYCSAKGYSVDSLEIRAGKSRGGKHPASDKTRAGAKKMGLSNKGRKHKPGHGTDGVKVTNSQKWECLVTGMITTSGPLSRFQMKRGIDTSLRRRIS